MFDLETNPNLWGIDKEYIDSLDVTIKEKVNKIFADSHRKENAPDSNLLNNIY